MRWWFPAVAWLGLVATVRGAEEWIGLSTPHFSVVSEASEAKTRAWAVEFELFRRGMMIVMPVEAAAVEPVTLVLFRSDRRLRPFKPLENGEPAKVAGYFARAPGRNTLAISLEGARDDVRELIFHEAVHWHLSAAARSLPLWMEEGLAGLFGNFRLSGNSFVIGANRPGFIRHVRIARPMPVAQMMAIEPGGLTYNGKHGEHTELFYYQAWAMMHALIFGTEGVGRTKFADFLRLPPIGTDPAGEIEAGMGVSVEVLEKTLATHIDGGRFRTLQVTFDRSAVEAGFKSRPLAAAEVDLAFGNLLVGVNRATEAEPYLRRASTGLPDDPRGPEALGAMSQRLEQPDDMERHFTEAFRRGSRSYLGYFLIGQREMLAAMKSNFGAADPTRAVALLERSLQLNPRFAPAAEALANLLTLLPQRSPTAEAAVQIAAVRFPGNFRILAGLALLEATHGPVESARFAIARAQGVPLRTDPVGLGVLSGAILLLETRERIAKSKAP